MHTNLGNKTFCSQDSQINKILPASQQCRRMDQNVKEVELKPLGLALEQKVHFHFYSCKQVFILLDIGEQQDKNTQMLD
jgi:hypothetical protein